MPTDHKALTRSLTAMIREPITPEQVRARATSTVDLALAGASRTYIANNRDRMIRDELTFARFELEVAAGREAAAVRRAA